MRTATLVAAVLGLTLTTPACVVGDEAEVADPPGAPYAASPVGWFDGIDDAGVASGWARDPDDDSRTITVHFYVYGPSGAVQQVDGVVANQYRADVGRHGWSFQIPARYRAPGYRFRAFGIDAVGGDRNLELSGGPRWWQVAPPPSAVTSGCLTGYTWDAANATYVNDAGRAARSGLDRRFHPGKPTVVLVGQSVDLILANALQDLDPTRNYVVVPCDDPAAAGFDYGRWTAAIRDWIQPQVPRIDYLAVGLTHRALCPRRLAVGDIAIARLRELRQLLPRTTIAAINYPLVLDRAMTDAAYASFFACFDPGYPNAGSTRAYAYERQPPRYRDYVETTSAQTDVIDVWTGTFRTTDGIHPDGATATAAAREFVGYLR